MSNLFNFRLGMSAVIFQIIYIRVQRLLRLYKDSNHAVQRRWHHLWVSQGDLGPRFAKVIFHGVGALLIVACRLVGLHQISALVHSIMRFAKDF